MELPFLNKKKAPKRDPNRCAYHYYRPKVANCPKCATPICQECFSATLTGLCPECVAEAYVPGEGDAASGAAPEPKKAKYARKPPPKKGKKAIPAPAKPTQRRISSEKVRRRIVWIAAGILVPVFITLLVLTFMGLNPMFRTRPRQLTPAQKQEQLKRFVLFAAEGIDSYKKKHGRPPAAVGDIGITDPENWEYEVRKDGTYKIAAKDGDVRVFYDSTLDRSTIFADAPGGAGAGSKR